MTTYAELKTAVAEVLSDPANKTFTAAAIAAIIQESWAEIGRVAPAQYREDVDILANQTAYQLRPADFPLGVPEVEVVAVELWDGSQSPPLQLAVLDPAVGEYTSDSQAGWRVWGGILDIPRTVIINAAGNEAIWLLKVRGYSPYVKLVNDADVSSMSNELEQALLIYAHVAGLRRLNASRELFSQWQTRSGNTDMSPAGLMNALNIALEEWRRTRNSIRVLREAPG